MNPSIEQLLSDLKHQNESDEHADAFPQVASPGTYVKHLPTLSDSATRKVSPMVEARFKFAGRWENAIAGEVWLGPDEIGSWQGEEAVKAQIQLRIEHWTHSLVANTSEACLTLFGIDQVEGGETYIVWGKEGTEPRIAHYADYDELIFPDLRRFLYWLLGRES